MKLFSMPGLLLGAAGVIVAGGLLYATSSNSTPPKVAATSTPIQPAIDSSGTPTPASTDSAAAPAVVADAGPTVAQALSTNGTANPGQPGKQQGEHHHHMEQVFAQLGLTDAQKQQIEQIRQSSADKQTKRQAIMQVLTPEQQAQFQQLRGQFKNHGGAGGAPSTPTTTGT